MSTSQKNKIEVAKLWVTPALTLVVAIVGWILTDRYNSTQIQIAEQRGKDEIEITRISAAMKFMELDSSFGKDDAIRRRHAFSIAAPVLPPDLAFRLAIDQVNDDSGALDILLAKYNEEALPYLARAIEVPFADLQHTLDPIVVSGPYATPSTIAESRAISLLQYLRERGWSKPMFDHIVAKSYGNEEVRQTALVLYFEDYRKSLQNDVGYSVQQAYQEVLAKSVFRSYLENRSITSNAKRAIVFAFTIVFANRFHDMGDLYADESAKRFWEGMDISRGATPAAGTIQAYLYQQFFHFEDIPGTRRWYAGKGVLRASESLRKALLNHGLDALSFEEVRLIIYAYGSSPTVAGRGAYLVPSDFVQVMRAILEWANSADRRRDLSLELGSLSGTAVFQNMLPRFVQTVTFRDPAPSFVKEDHRKRREAAKEYAIMMLDWYKKYFQDDWEIPKFIDDVVSEFPDLESRVDRKNWGLGAPWPEASVTAPIGPR